MNACLAVMGGTNCLHSHTRQPVHVKLDKKTSTFAFPLHKTYGEEVHISAWFNLRKSVKKSFLLFSN